MSDLKRLIEIFGKNARVVTVIATLKLISEIGEKLQKESNYDNGGSK